MTPLRSLRKRTPLTFAFLTTNGWTIEKGASGHIRAVSPSGRRIVLSGTPSDGRTDRNQLTRLRRIEREEP